MTDFQYLQIKEMIKQNHFRKTAPFVIISSILLSISIIMMLLSFVSGLGSHLRINEPPMLNSNVRILLIITSFLFSLAVLILRITSEVDENIQDKEDQLKELEEVRKWCKENPEEAKNLDFSGPYTKKIWKEFFG